jgi:hypothetical protein
MSAGLAGPRPLGLAAALARDCLAPDLPQGFITRDPTRPAAAGARGGGGAAGAEAEWDHAMVFMVGGGSLAERADVERAVAGGCGMPVAYGCTDLVSPPAFLAQLR